MSPKKFTVASLGLKSVKEIAKDEIPNREKGSVIKNLDEFKDAETIIKAVAEHGAAPFEAFDLIDADVVRKRVPKAQKLKTLLITYSHEVRKLLKAYQVEKLVHLEQRKERLFLVSNE